MEQGPEVKPPPQTATANASTAAVGRCSGANCARWSVHPLCFRGVSGQGRRRLVAPRTLFAGVSPQKYLRGTSGRSAHLRRPPTIGGTANPAVLPTATPSPAQCRDTLLVRLRQLFPVRSPPADPHDPPAARTRGPSCSPSSGRRRPGPPVASPAQSRRRSRPPPAGDAGRTRPLVFGAFEIRPGCGAGLLARADAESEPVAEIVDAS